MPWKLRPMDRTDSFARSLRRLTFGSSGRTCPGDAGGHDVSTPTLETLERPDTDLEGDRTARLPHDDPRWPTACAACGYAFQEDDAWQVVDDRLYRLRDTGELVRTADAPVGAAWYSAWHAENDFLVSRQYDASWRASRLPILVKLPPGGRNAEMCVDAPWSDEARPNPDRDGWTITGSMDDGTLTVSPSIDRRGIYHGFLQAGVITEDCEGRAYPDLPRS